MRTHWLNNVMLKGSGKTRLLAGFLMTAAMVLAQGYPQGAPPQGQYPPPQAQVGASGAPGEAAPVDEPGRAVARLGILNGDASIRRGDSTDWVAAATSRITAESPATSTRAIRSDFIVPHGSHA